MALKTFNPTSPGRRQLVLVHRSELHKGKTKRFRGVPGQRSDTKKAIVTLLDGYSIDVTTGL